MKSLAEELPPEIASRVHPDWRKNEADYWTNRDALLGQYRNLWVAFADGKVIASGSSPVEVFKAAHLSGLHPFVTLAGREDEPSRMRRVTFPYDTTYPIEPLPVLNVEFRTVSGSPGMMFDRVIPDTGADASALPWPDCQALQLDVSQGTPGRITGVAGSAIVTLGFLVWVWLDGQEYPCRLQADFYNPDRILGRDVLNQLEILFRGPAREVIVNP